MSKALTKEILLERLNKVKIINGDKYDYSKVDFVDKNSIINIICKNHGLFPQILINHLNGAQCVKCSKSKRRSNTKEFIEKALLIDGNIDKFGYDFVVYVDNKTDIDIMCYKHNGIFKQSPNHHLAGFGCNVCYYSRLTEDNFKDRFIEIHKDLYEYDNFIFIDSSTAGQIKCKIHNLFFPQTPNAHLRGVGCPDCGGTRKRTNEEFIERGRKRHGDKFDYSLTNYINDESSVKIICPFHGEFEQIAGTHYRSDAFCCSGTPKLTNIDIDNYLIENEKEFIRVGNYDGAHKDIEWQCKLCNHIWIDKPNTVKYNAGCPECDNGYGRNERNIRKFFKINDIIVEKFYVKLPINIKYSIPDFYIPSLNLIVEYNGAQHYKPVKFRTMSKEQADKNFIRQQTRDQQLREYCDKEGYNLLEIDGREYTEIKLKQFLKDYFLNDNRAQI